MLDNIADYEFSGIEVENSWLADTFLVYMRFDSSTITQLRAMHSLKSLVLTTQPLLDYHADTENTFYLDLSKQRVFFTNRADMLVYKLQYNCDVRLEAPMWISRIPGRQ